MVLRLDLIGHIRSLRDHNGRKCHADPESKRNNRQHTPFPKTEQISPCHRFQRIFALSFTFSPCRYFFHILYRFHGRKFSDFSDNTGCSKKCNQHSKADRRCQHPGPKRDHRRGFSQTMQIHLRKQCGNHRQGNRNACHTSPKTSQHRDFPYLAIRDASDLFPGCSQCF